jgi:hypothetical protein
VSVVCSTCSPAAACCTRTAAVAQSIACQPCITTDDVRRCNIESEHPNPDTEVVLPAPPGVTRPPPPPLTGPVYSPAPPSGLSVRGATISKFWIFLVLIALAIVALCCWRRWRRRKARVTNRKRRRSAYTPRGRQDDQASDDSSYKSDSSDEDSHSSSVSGSGQGSGSERRKKRLKRSGESKESARGKQSSVDKPRSGRRVDKIRHKCDRDNKAPMRSKSALPAAHTPSHDEKALARVKSAPRASPTRKGDAGREGAAGSTKAGKHGHSTSSRRPKGRSSRLHRIAEVSEHRSREGNRFSHEKQRAATGAGKTRASTAFMECDKI